MPEYVYKALPTGGYTSLLVESAVHKARKVAEGWSETAPQAPQPVPESVEPAMVVEAPKRRGRRPTSEAVN